MTQSATLGVCVVTYKEPFSVTSAHDSLSALPEALRRRLRVVSVCNSAPAGLPANRAHTDAVLPYTEIALADNLGLAGGYNAGLPPVLADGADAVLFLNADAKVGEPYISWLLASLERSTAADGFAPTLMSRGAQVSPFRKRAMAMGFYIIGYLCLRASPFLRELRFPQEFWLDGIDYWLSARIDQAALKIELAPLIVEHNLSVSDQFGTLPAWRYRNILVSERTFLKHQQRPFLDLCIVYARAYLRCLRYRRFDLAQVVMNEFAMARHER